LTIPLTDAPRVDAGRGPDSAGWPDRGALWADDLDAWFPAFIGRARELDRLGDLLAEAGGGRPRIAVVEGEAGLGKSSLITEFLSRHRQVPVLAASGEVSEQALPWGMVRQLAHHADTDQVAALTLLGGPAASADPLLVGEELVALFAARSARGVLAVVIEDLQWADQQSARALLFTCRRLAGDKVLVIVSARAQQLGRLGDGWTRFLTGDRRCSRLALARLSAAELAELAAASGRSGLSGRALRRVADHSGGNPLFARAMLTELPDDVLEGPEDGLYLPRSLAAVILPGLEALPAGARSLVVAASVLGEPCTVSDAAVLAGVPQPDNALDQAVAAGFLVALPDHRGLRFARELIRRAVYCDIGTARRRSLHRWAAAMTDGAESLRHRVAAAAGTDLALALELDAAAAASAGCGGAASAAALYIGAAQLGARGREREDRLLSALELLVRTADASAADALRPQAEHLPASARRDAVLGQLAMLTARPAAAEALFLAAWSAHEERSEPTAAAEAAAGLAMIYANASERECLRWARRSMQVCPGSLPPAVLGA
jgi:hypothetical protein